MGSFLRIYLHAFHQPSAAFRQLTGEPHYLSRGLRYLLIPMTGYTLMYVFLHVGDGAPSVFTPWLNIPPEQYYAANRWLLAPSMLLCWILASGVMQLLSYAGGGKGSFEQTAAAVALAISVAMWGGLIHDLPMSIFSALRIIDARQHELDMNSPTVWRSLLWAAYSLYTAAFMVLFSTVVRVVHRIPGPRSFGIGLLSFLIFQLVFLVFNR